MGVPDAPSLWFAGWCGTAGAATPGSLWRSQQRPYYQRGSVRWEGPNAKPSVRTFVLVVVALIAANPFGGLAGRVRR